MSSRDWHDRVVMITHIDGPVTQDSLQQKYLRYGVVVKSFLTESGKRKPLGYLTFHESKSALAMVLDHGKDRPGTRASWMAKVPEGGEWNKWIPPTQDEVRRAKELAFLQSREAAAASLGTGPAHGLGLNPREIFFVDGHLTLKEKEAKLEKVFGPASRSFPSFPLYIATVVNSAQKWFPRCIERGEGYEEIDHLTQTEFIKQCVQDPQWKTFLDKADPLSRTPELVLRRKLDLVREVVPPVQPRPVPRPTSTGPREGDPRDPRTLVLQPISLSAKSVALVLSQVALVDIDPEHDFVASPDGSYAVVKFRTVEQAERAYAVVNRLELPWNNERIRLFRSRASNHPAELAETVHINLATAISVAAAHNSLVQFGSIESCRRAPEQDGQSGIILQFEEQDSLLRLKRYYNRHVADRDEYPFHNRGEVFVNRVDTLDKWEDLLRQWNEAGSVHAASKEDVGDRFVAHGGPRYARVYEISTWKQIAYKEVRADNTDFTPMPGSLLRDPKRDKREGDIRLKIVPFGDLPVPLPLSLTGREYGLKAEWIDKWTPSPFFGPSPSSARVGSENSHHDELSNRRDDVGPSRPSRPGSAIGNMADTERAASRPDEDVMMSAPDEVLPDLSGPSVEPKESAEVADPPPYIPPRRAPAKRRIKPTPVAYNLKEETVKFVLLEIRKKHPTFTYNEAVALLWDNPWIRVQTHAKLHEQRLAQRRAEAQSGSSADAPGGTGGP